VLVGVLLGGMQPAAVEAAPGDDATCDLHAELSATRRLRRTALALLGRIPTLDEYAQVSGKPNDDGAFDSVIDGWLQSDDYRLQMRRYHLDLLWTNPAGTAFMDGGHSLFPTTPDSNIWYLPATQRSKGYRGGNGSHRCQNVPQESLQPSYQLGDPPFCQPSGTDNVGPYCMEGWVEVAPFFDPNITIKVCAFEAQTAASYIQPNGPNFYNSGSTSPCNQRQARGHSACGCGPNLRWCLFDRTYEESEELLAAMQEQLLRVVDDHTLGNQPYRELLTTKKSYSTGILDHYLKHQAAGNNYSSAFNRMGDDASTLPSDPDWTDTSWHEVTRPDPHAGILTLPAYLLRYQTGRARANRFRIAFLGQYFLPPSTDDTEGCSTNAADLTKRCICRGCHETLEPLVSYFGAFAEAGSSMLTHFVKEASSLEECATQILPGNNGVCSRFYKPVAQAGGGVIYRRLPLEFTDDHPEYTVRYDQGPIGIVTGEALENFGDKPYSVLAWSTTRNLFRFLTHRDFALSTGQADDEQAVLDELATAFETSDFDFKALTRSIVTHPIFLRMP
jgi:hypothetical protein